MQFWSPFLSKDVLALEGVQRRFTGMFPGMAGLMYEERLTRIWIVFARVQTMEEGWGGELIETHNILTGRDRVDAGRIFPMMGNPEPGATA